MRTRRRPMARIGIAVICALSAGCSTAPARGPLADTQATTTTCAPAALGASASFGAANWNNPIGELLTIDDVSLVDPDGVELVGAFVVPNPGDGRGGSAGIGADLRFPPERNVGNTLAWDRQQAIPGARLQPTVQTDLVIGVRHTRQEDGSSRAVRITYHSSRESFVFDIPARYILADTAKGCNGSNG